MRKGGGKKKIIKKKREKFFEILNFKNGINCYSATSWKIKYYSFRPQFFIYKLTKFGFLKKKIFVNELPEILFGFGDIENSPKQIMPEIESLVINYILDIVSSVTHISFWRVAKRPTIDDVLFLVRNHTRKFQRVIYLQKMKLLIEKITGSDKNEGPLHKKKFFSLK
mmetsp:Transcript_4673/g.9533  ORF Transcript_4673/g.9533 Transcript_4673/m.9533 type:complete len:167 (-) Transcript_4673:955-1455(-)